MGIKNLSKFLRTQCPDIYETIHLSEYAYKKVAIDTSLYLCNYKALYGDKGWLSAFIKLVACLRKNEIHCVFIYDSGAPPEKDAERKERALQRAKLQERVYKLEEAIEEYNNTGEISQVLIDFQNKRKIKLPRLLKPGRVAININAIQYHADKMRKQMFEIRPKDFEMTRKLFDILQVPYFHAPLEAETMCSDLCKAGLVDAVLSEDTDVLAYATPTFLLKIDTRDETCMRINYNRLLDELQLTSDQFLDFCIMCGTDYNKNIFRVGPMKSYKYITDHKNIETIDKKTKLDVSILCHKRGRELFREYERKDVNVTYCGKPDFLALQRFVVEKNLRVDIEALRRCFVQQNIVIVDESEPEESEEEIIIEESEEEIVID
jgi:5'-3' exonuclease